MRLGISATGILFAVFLLSLGAMGSGALQPQISPLNGTNPQAYLEFAESQYTDSQSSSTIAIQSALHGAWIANEMGDHSLAASCVIAAAAFVPDRESRDLWDLAVTLDPTRELQWRAHRDAEDTAELLAADIVLNARYGLDEADSSLLASTEIHDLINSALPPSNHTQSGTTATRVGTLIESAAEDTCGGRIFIPRKNPDTKQIERVLCPDHTRPLGAGRSDAEFIELLSVEMNLRGVRSHAWGQAGGAPLFDPTIIDMMYLYQVAPDRPCWREGRWLPPA